MIQLNNNQYQIQGIAVHQLIEEFGSPLYVYSADTIFNQVSKLNTAFKDLPVFIKYAAKALTNLSILKVIKSSGVGLDVVSVQELELGLMAGFTANEIMFTPNCTPFEEIQFAVSKGVHLNIDNLPYLERFGQEYGSSYPVCIRINPHIEAGGNDKIKTGHVESKFGISVDQLNEIYQIVKKYQIDISGVHVHTGSDFSDVNVFMQSAKVIFDIALNFPNIRFIDFGSGFKVAYKEGDKTTNLDDLAEKMISAYADFVSKYGKSPQIWFEPGKFLVSDSGTLLTTAHLLKPTPATTFVGIDSGLNHLIRPMMYNAHHDIVNVSNPNGVVSNYSVVGYICETDTFAWERPLTEVRVGDTIALKNAGAYGFSMSSNYNSRFRPAEVLIVNGKAQLIRRRETMEDILRGQIDVLV